MLDILLDALTDCVRLLPFLFLSYLAVEYIEHRMDDRSKEMIYHAGKAGPLIGSLLGVIPQCGFSAAAAGLFAARVVSPGTLIAIFLSTSDEMLPLMLSAGIQAGVIFRVLVVKVAAGALIGLLVDFIAARLHLWNPSISEKPRILPPGKRIGEGERGQKMTGLQLDPGQAQKKPVRHLNPGWPQKKPVRHLNPGRPQKKPDWHLDPGQPEHKERMHMCDKGHCNCNEEGIFRAALHHTLQTALFLFLISWVLGFGMEWFQDTAFSRGIFSIPQIQATLAALVGMIPNCAASVLITQLYLEGVLGSGALFSGLLCGAGTGLLVLYRENDRPRENLVLTVVLYVSGVFAGTLAGSAGIL
ncbi:MAG: arsenic efflux protein [Lachnospiraceae bacterium]|nr:arsenic efflux protein [Lachnospiraceae bacterium]